MTYTGNCDHPGCGAAIRPAATQAQFNRNLGLHRRSAHGVVSTHNNPSRRRKYVRKPASEATPAKAKPAGEANVRPMFLSECPECHCRFYLSKP